MRKNDVYVNGYYMALLNIPNTTIESGDVVLVINSAYLDDEKVYEVQKINKDKVYEVPKINKSDGETFTISDEEFFNYFFNYIKWEFNLNDSGIQKGVFLNKERKRNLRFYSEGTDFYSEDFDFHYLSCNICYKTDKYNSDKNSLFKSEKSRSNKLKKIGFEYNELEEHWQIKNLFFYSKQEAFYFSFYIVRYLKLIENIDVEFINSFNFIIVKTLKNIAIIKRHQSESDTLKAIKSSETLFKELYETAKNMNEEIVNRCGTVNSDKNNLLLLEFEKQIELSSSFLKDLKGEKALDHSERLLLN